MLIILAGITLNAVIGENGIIFQAKDTKNLVDNETRYDNEQLASLQNELKDNQLYSGIGIIPGTDQGGSSEGGENGTGTNQGGQTNSGENKMNTQDPNPGGGTLVDGKTDEDPKILVTAGEAVAASFYQTDVTIQIYTLDRSKKIKYILSTTVTAITDELYPSGLVREIDIENGGTLTFTKDGEYTITAYAYDTQGNKSNPTIMWFKRQTGGITAGGLTITKVSGNLGQNGWYTSNVTLRILGTNTGSAEIRYRVQGTVTGTGLIGDDSVEIGSIDTGEVKIANGTTFRITADGSYTITAYDYDNNGARISSSEVLTLNKDATRPVVKAFTGEQIPGTGFKVTVDAEDVGSNLVTNAYSYKHRLSETNGEFTSETSNSNTKIYTGLNQQKTYDMYVAVTDQAGNTAITDVIARPSLYVSSGTAGETSADGARSYYRSNVAMTLRGQDSNNADISKTTYQIIGTVTEPETNGGSGSIDGTTRANGAVLPANEVEIGDKTSKTIQLNANGNWTVKVRNYNKEGKIVTTSIYEVTRDTIAPSASGIKVGDITFRQLGSTTVDVINSVDITSSEVPVPLIYEYYCGDVLKARQNSDSYNYRESIGSEGVPKVRLIDKAGNFSDLMISNDVPLRYNFTYCGLEAAFYLPSGEYLIEVWGAEGGSAFYDIYGGRGGYSSGVLTVTDNNVFFATVGGIGGNANSSGTTYGGFGGGGVGVANTNSRDTRAGAGRWRRKLALWG